MTSDFQLTERARRWIYGIKAQFTAKPMGVAAAPAMADPAFKIL